MIFCRLATLSRGRQVAYGALHGDPSRPLAPATFESFGLRPEVLAALRALGYEEPTPIQRETIPVLISGRDVLGQAATGTGKTAAFALPILERVTPKDRRPFEAQALVLVPTRELAMQVAEAVQKYGVGVGVTALAVYGGQDFQPGAASEARRRRWWPLLGAHSTTSPERPCCSPR